MTMFFGTGNPVLSRSISTLKSKYGGNDALLNKILSIFTSTADICTATIVHHNIERQDTQILVLRCITGATLMYDHLSPTGAFNKQVPFANYDALKTVHDFQPKQTALINAIKYSSKHLQDPTTLPSIKELFA